MWSLSCGYQKICMHRNPLQALMLTNYKGQGLHHQGQAIFEDGAVAETICGPSQKLSPLNQRSPIPGPWPSADPCPEPD